MMGISNSSNSNNNNSCSSNNNSYNSNSAIRINIKFLREIYPLFSLIHKYNHKISNNSNSSSKISRIYNKRRKCVRHGVR